MVSSEYIKATNYMCQMVAYYTRTGGKYCTIRDHGDTTTGYSPTARRQRMLYGRKPISEEMESRTNLGMIGCLGVDMAKFRKNVECRLDGGGLGSEKRNDT